jgi:hypothetical protein
MKLEKDDLDKIGAIMLKYQETHKKLTILENEMKDLLNKQQATLLQLQIAREEEKQLQDKLFTKHGPGNLNIRTMEWINI